MAQAQTDLDDVASLLATTRALVGQAHQLSRQIDDTVEELTEFQESVSRDRRRRQMPYEGEDRRA